MLSKLWSFSSVTM